MIIAGGLITLPGFTDQPSPVSVVILSGFRTSLQRPVPARLVKRKEAILLVCGHLFLPAMTGAVIRISYFRFQQISKIRNSVVFAPENTAKKREGRAGVSR